MTDAAVKVARGIEKSIRSGYERALIDRCIAAAAAAHQVPASIIKSASRQRPHVRARWHAMHLLREVGFSLPEIGAALNRHHTSIMHGLAEQQRFRSEGTTRRSLLPTGRQYREDASSKEGSI